MGKTIGIAGLIVHETDENGYVTSGRINNSSAALDTTADTYAIGCVLTDAIDGKSYYNSGTVAVPVWNSVSEVVNAEVAQDVQKVIQVDLTAANINGMYAAAVEVVAAISGKAIIVDDVVLDLTGTATQFAAGGVAGVQYKNTVNGAGQLVHADIAAAVITGATARVVTHRVGVDVSSIAVANIVGVGLFISNKTQAFTTGTGTAVLTIRYHTI